MQKTEQENFSDVEAALEGLRPVALSARFFDAVEAELSASGNTVRMPSPASREPRSRGGRLLRFPFRRAATSAALLAGAVGLGTWGYFLSLRVPGGNATAVPATLATAVAKSVPAAARAGGDFRLVNMERRMNSVTPVDFVAREDGTVERRLRCSYTDESWWEDDEKGAAYVELRPHEELVSMEVAVY